MFPDLDSLFNFDDAPLADGLSWRPVIPPSGGLDLLVVPEPGTLVLSGLGGLCCSAASCAGGCGRPGPGRDESSQRRGCAGATLAIGDGRQRRRPDRRPSYAARVFLRRPCVDRLVLLADGRRHWTRSRSAGIVIASAFAPAVSYPTVEDRHPCLLSLPKRSLNLLPIC